MADKAPYIEKLTRSATADARSRGEFHARLNSYTGVKLLSVSDEVRTGPGGGQQFGFAEAKAEAYAAAADVASEPSLDPSPVVISVSLYFTFEMTR